MRVKDFFVNEKEFIIYYKYQMANKVNECVPDEGSIEKQNLHNLIFVCDEASRRYLLAQERQIEANVNELVFLIEQRKRLMREEMNYSFHTEASASMVEEDSQREIPLEELKVDLRWYYN